jgi:hypothetical protein
MPTKLVKPKDLQFMPVGSGFPFADGTSMHPSPDGCFLLPDNQSHHLHHMLNTGWRVYEKPVPKIIYKDEFERAAVEKPLAISAILDLCEAEKVKIRVEADTLKVKALNGYVSPGLRAHLQLRRIELRNELARQAAILWEDV